MQSVAKLWWGLVGFGFRLLYNELAFTYDVVSKVVSRGAWRCWQRAALKHLTAVPSARILELAHGTGDLQIDLKQAGYETVGHDLSRAMGRITRRKLARQGMTAALSRGKAQQLPYKDRAFMAVIATFPTDFILKPETLAEVRRVLTDDGQFIIVPNGRFVGGGLVRRLLEWLYRITGQMGDEGAFEAQIKAFFDQHGFSLEIMLEPCIRQTVAQVLICRKKA